MGTSCDPPLFVWFLSFSLRFDIACEWSEWYSRVWEIHLNEWIYWHDDEYIGMTSTGISPFLCYPYASDGRDCPPLRYGVSIDEREREGWRKPFRWQWQRHRRLQFWLGEFSDGRLSHVVIKQRKREREREKERERGWGEMPFDCKKYPLRSQRIPSPVLMSMLKTFSHNWLLKAFNCKIPYR